MSERAIVVVSNRGPVSFRRDASGELTPHRGAGGLVSGLTPLMRRADRTWIAAAMSDADRQAVTDSPAATSVAGTSTSSTSVVPHRRVDIDGIQAVVAGVDADDLAASYDTVCNATLWFVHHHLFALGDQPVFDRSWFAAWEAYVRVNEAFADLIVEVTPADAVVLVQDYHLYLAGESVAARRPDLAMVHFSHTPFSEPHQFAVLPDEVRHRILTGLAAHTACGFHTAAWRDAFDACCSADAITPPSTFVAPLGPDVDDLAATRDSGAFAEATADLEAAIGDRRCIARSERIEPSKNLVRGFLAFDTLLHTHPEWQDRVVFVASVYPSRESLQIYVDHRERIEACVARINDRWGTPTWTPILLDTRDHFPTTVATLARADVVLVNPVRDGLNLVASEAMLVNDRDALLALSPQAGVHALLGEAAADVHPFDVVQTAETLHELLSTPTAERASTAARLRSLAAGRTPADWLADQLASVG